MMPSRKRPFYAVERGVEAPPQEAPEQDEHIGHAQAVINEVQPRAVQGGEGGHALRQPAEAQGQAQGMYGQVYGGGDELALRHEVGKVRIRNGSVLHQPSSFLLSS